VSVTDKLSYTVKWVDFDNQLPATPAQPQPSVAQTATSSASSSSGGSTYTPPSTTTPDCDYYCNALSYVASKTPPSSSPSWINQALVNAALSDQQRTALIHQWGTNDVPSSAAAWTGEIGCQNYAYVQTTAYTSVGAC